MDFKRVFAMILACLIFISAASVLTSAMDVYTEEETTEEGETTVTPTEEPKPTPSLLGYQAYAQKLSETVYKGQLGAIYSQKATTFRVWSPVADLIKVCIYKTGSDSEKNAQMISSNAMEFDKASGLWSLTLKGDYKNLYYTYLVTVDGSVNEVVDPYAKAAGVNGDRGMIVDLDETDPDGWDEDKFDRADYQTEAVIWEVNVRDFSASASSGVSADNRGKFLAFTESGTTLNDRGSIATCVDYLKEMGVNYVQINPFYDFASIDETNTEDPEYNWGYDPKNYNVPEGSYSSNPYDGRVRIKECKQMIKALHDAGIGVIMDVVYNHTYYSEDSFLNQLVPYYYHRINEDGSWSNGSGCGNDLATERYMVSRMIKDSVTYWAEEYHIDGFRFDLMGLMDTKTVTAIRNSLDTLENGKKIFMYGEAWNLSTTVPSDVLLANQDNMYLLNKRIGAFNDTSRDAIKGSVFNRSDSGFVQTGDSKAGVRSAVNADGGGWATVPNQCVNYASCHDNNTLYDKLTDSVYGDEKYELRREDLVAMNKLSGAIILMSQGTPFMLAGEEMGRTKLGDENSYKSDVSVNQIDWSYINKFNSLVDYYKGLIAIRKAVGTLNDESGTHTDIDYLTTTGNGCVAYKVSGVSQPSVIVAFNGSPDEKAQISLPKGKWTLVADGDRAGLENLGTYTGSYTVPETSAAVFIDSDSFFTIGSTEKTAVLYIRYKDRTTDTVIYEEKITGELDGSYNMVIPDDVLFNYNIHSGLSKLSGTFDKSYDIREIDCEPYEGDYSSVTFKYVDQNGQRIYDSIVLTNRVGQKYSTPQIPGIEGYTLDLNGLPDNGSGRFTEEGIEVVFKYREYTAGEDAVGNMNCRANVIYMGDEGEILDAKTYMGTDGDMLVLDVENFDGYRYLAVSDSYASFSPIESNVIVYYGKEQTRNYKMINILVVTGAAVLVTALVAYFVIRARRRRFELIDIIDLDDELFSEIKDDL